MKRWIGVIAKGAAAAFVATGVECAITWQFPALFARPYELYDFLGRLVGTDGGRAYAATLGIASTPSILAGLLVYRFLARKDYDDGRTRCGQCRRVLEGLEEPKCPWCGATL